MDRILAGGAAQLLAIDLADLFESLLQLAIVLQAAAHQRHLFRPQGLMMDLSAGITGGQDPGWMPATGGAGSATASMTDGAMEERAAEGGAREGKALQDTLNSLLVRHFHCIQ
jgi:hypothetical protein